MSKSLKLLPLRNGAPSRSLGGLILQMACHHPKRGSSANSPTSATKAISELIRRAKEIALSKSQYLKSDIAAAGGFIDNTLPGEEFDNDCDNDSHVSNANSHKDFDSIDARSKEGKKLGKPKKNAASRTVLNDVMKVINADAVRHALRSQKERAPRML